ncbi:hypothetical protein QBC36DRAFT_128405 [Triangularia setosa]|uniref:Uncharacterized protein n=1 Tax=Triangularia setosa TaxID=2587417 RepID=A0AAN6W8Y3_9PEZI|nr:hypothetical protein QBC36DRAFT_128405 [Podospora setosa]
MGLALGSLSTARFHGTVGISFLHWILSPMWVIGLGPMTVGYCRWLTRGGCVCFPGSLSPSIYAPNMLQYVPTYDAEKGLSTRWRCDGAQRCKLLFGRILLSARTMLILHMLHSLAGLCPDRIPSIACHFRITHRLAQGLAVIKHTEAASNLPFWNYSCALITSEPDFWLLSSVGERLDLGSGQTTSPLCPQNEMHASNSTVTPRDANWNWPYVAWARVALAWLQGTLRPFSSSTRWGTFCPSNWARFFPLSPWLNLTEGSYGR